MQMLDKQSFVIQDIIGKNVVLASCGQEECLLYGNEIGTSPVGEALKKNNDLKAYFIDMAGFRRVLRETEYRIIAACIEAINYIESEMEEMLDPQIHITLTDHLAVLIERLRNQERITNPVLVQTEILYQREYQLAQKVIHLLEEHLQITIPDSEIGFIALHIHGARNVERAEYIMQYPFLANAVTIFLENEFGEPINKDTLDYMRLITHLKFAIERVATGNPIKNLLLEQIQEEYGVAYNIAAKAAAILEKTLECSFPEDEIAFLALYVERLRNP